MKYVKARTAFQRFSEEKVFWKYTANLLENTHVEVWFQETLESSQRRFFTFSGVIPTVTVMLKFQGNDATWKMEKSYKSLVKLL